MARLPSGNDVIKIERSAPETDHSSRGFDERFIGRLQQSGYLDSAMRRTSGPQRLGAQYKADGLVLFLGAGVSKTSGVPEWRELLDTVLQAVGATPKTLDVTSLSFSKVLQDQAGLSMLSQFDLVAHECSGKEPDRTFVDLLREHLYGHKKFSQLRTSMNQIPTDNDAKLSFDWEPIVKQLSKNRTLAAVGDLLVDTSANPVTANQKIGAVLTTNVDNLVQTYVMARAQGRRLLATVDRASVGDHPGMTSIYHLHGWIDPRTERPLRIVNSPLVFRETEYFDSIANPNSFANYTAQSLFQRRNVLFIGTSMEDINVRRWLYNSFEERRRHRFEFLRERYPGYEGAEAEAYAASIRHFWLKRELDLPEPRDIIKTFIADSMRHMGVEVIWYKEHDDVAEILRSVRNFAVE